MGRYQKDLNRLFRCLVRLRRQRLDYSELGVFIAHTNRGYVLRAKLPGSVADLARHNDVEGIIELAKEFLAETGCEAPGGLTPPAPGSASGSGGSSPG